MNFDSQNAGKPAESRTGRRGRRTSGLLASFNAHSVESRTFTRSAGQSSVLGFGTPLRALKVRRLPLRPGADSVLYQRGQGKSARTASRWDLAVSEQDVEFHFSIISDDGKLDLGPSHRIADDLNQVIHVPYFLRINFYDKIAGFQPGTRGARIFVPEFRDQGAADTVILVT